MQKTCAAVSFRAVFIGLVCAIAECLAAPYNDYVIRNVFLAGGHFPVGPFFVLTILILCVNVILRKVNPGHALSAQELITMFWLLTLTER